MRVRTSSASCRRRGSGAEEDVEPRGAGRPAGPGRGGVRVRTGDALVGEGDGGLDLPAPVAGADVVAAVGKPGIRELAAGIRGVGPCEEPAAGVVLELDRRGRGLGAGGAGSRV